VQLKNPQKLANMASFALKNSQTGKLYFQSVGRVRSQRTIFYPRTNIPIAIPHRLCFYWMECEFQQ
jgi:hypothetical protein